MATTRRSALVGAIENTNTYTENGMPTPATSGRDVLDMFFKYGAARQLSDTDTLNFFVRAFAENKRLATKCLFYNRDVRSGQGERRSFRLGFRWLAQNHTMLAEKLLPFVPFYGRWDDVLLTTVGTPTELAALNFYADALHNGDALAAKWAPRENKKNGNIAKKLALLMDISPKMYRKMVATLSNTVEDYMCSRRWETINYSHVPSIAANRYRKAFLRNDESRYKEYLTELAKPVSERKAGVKVNADVIFPHNIVEKFMSRYSRPSTEESVLLQAQWDALPEYVPQDNNTLAVVDVSGSMTGEPMNVAVALGLYLSERLDGPFKDTFVTFSTNPTLQRVHGTLANRVDQTVRSQWSMSTNLEKVFRLILNTARSNNLPQSELPSTLIIFSDMQFNACVRNPSNTAMEMIRSEYARAGYQVPNVVFWNLRASNGTPVRFDENGTAMVSGFSPSTMKHILSGRMNPMEQMREVLESDRYSQLDTVFTWTDIHGFS